MFKVFEENLMDSIGLSCVEVENKENVSIYEVSEDGNKRSYSVQFELSKGMTDCICKLFESLGMLCCHALRVLVMNNIMSKNYLSNTYCIGGQKVQSQGWVILLLHQMRISLVTYYT